MESQPLKVDETEQNKTGVKEVGASTASLKDQHAALTDKSSSKSSVRSKVSLNARNEEEEWTLSFLDVLPPSLSASNSCLCLCPVLHLVPHDAPS